MISDSTNPGVFFGGIFSKEKAEILSIPFKGIKIFIPFIVDTFFCEKVENIRPSLFMSGMARQGKQEKRSHGKAWQEKQKNLKANAITM